MSRKEFSTFMVNGQYYGVDVQLVQEVTNGARLTEVPLAPKYIDGLINLRGQIATAISLRALFDLPPVAPESEVKNVICRSEGLLLSFVVDEVGDVIEVDEKDFEATPEMVSEHVRQFMNGVYKTPGALLSVVDVNKVIRYLSK